MSSDQSAVFSLILLLPSIPLSFEQKTLLLLGFQPRVVTVEAVGTIIILYSVNFTLQ